MSKTIAKALSAALVVALLFSVFSIGIAPTITEIKLNPEEGYQPLAAGEEDATNEVEEQIDEVLFPAQSVGLLETPAPEVDVYPTIVLPGISQSESILVDENGNPVKNALGNELKGGLLIIDPAKVAPLLIKKVFVPLVKSFVLQRDAGLTEAFYDVACELFSTQGSNPDGTTFNTFETVTYDYPVSEMTEEDRGKFYRQIPMQEYGEIVGEENLYLFSFPLLGNPITNGENLHEFIQMVKDQKGVDKVNIAAISLGGTVLTSYLNYEGADYNDINRIINAVSLLDGTDVMADFMGREFNLQDQFFFNEYLPTIFTEMQGASTLGYVVNVLLKFLPRSVIEVLLTRTLDAIHETMVLHSPQFWAMVPIDRYDALAERYLTVEERAPLKAITDEFNQAQLALKDNLLRANNEYGINVSFVSGYNLTYLDGDYNFFGVMASSNSTSSDAIIDIDSTTLGATYAPAGTELSAEYLATTDMNYVSPDKNLDLSTCLFKDNVWVINGQHHEVGRNNVVIGLAIKLIVEELDDVNSDPENYPQFNITRYTNTITRNLLPKAYEILDEPEGYSPELLAALQQAVDDANEMLEATNVFTAPDCETATENLRAVLIEAGAIDAPTSSKFSEVIESVAKFVNDAVMKAFGAKGFSDVLFPKAS